LRSPNDRRHLFQYELLTIETRELIATWVANGEPVNQVHELLPKSVDNRGDKGRSALRQWYEELTEQLPRAISPPPLLGGTAVQLPFSRRCCRSSPICDQQ
jgi:hypothetical protein